MNSLKHCFYILFLVLILYAIPSTFAQWVPQNSGTTQGLNGVDFDAQTGYACGEFGTILKTTDGGSNW